MTKKITMIDSGAFSVWNGNKENNVAINVRHYADYLVEQSDHYRHCINLDVIPGKPNISPSHEEAKAAVEMSWENQHYLESRGLQPMPIFHQGEDGDALKRIIDAGYERVGISPDNSASIKDKQHFLDVTFYTITDRHGLPIIKAHGFGVTAVRFMFRYPWYSLDSTTWKALARYGSILIPCAGKDGEPDYTQDPIVLPISNKSSKQYCLGNGVFLSNEHARTWLTDFLEAEGILVDEVEAGTEGYESRCRINLRVMQRVAKQLPVKPYRRSMFAMLAEKLRPEGGQQLGPRKLIFATEPLHAENKLLTDEGVPTRLLSYHKLRYKSDYYLRKYISYWRTSRS